MSAAEKHALAVQARRTAKEESEAQAGGSAKPGSATWVMTMRPEGGYVYRAELTLGAAEHVDPEQVLPCEPSLANDAQMIGELKITNLTKGFPGEPGIMFRPQGFEWATGDECVTDEDAPGFYFYATAPLAQGEYISEPLTLIQPDYYDPEHPDGNTDLLREDCLAPLYYDAQTGDQGGAETTIQGPEASNGNPEEYGELLGFCLGALGAEG